MPVVKTDGTPGLLATYELGPLINSKKTLPDLTAEIEKLMTPDGGLDMFAVTAAFRDYAFLASAYLLEPCWQRWCEGMSYRCVSSVCQGLALINTRRPQ